MKVAFAIAGLTTTTVFGAGILESLPSSERTDLEQRLSKWKSLYGKLAESNGFTPESINLESHSDMELIRFHETTLQVQEAAKQNPLATFSEFNQFALLNDEEFQQVLVKSFGNETISGPPLQQEGGQVEAGDIDWSTDKCNPPVRNQGSCGSCWAFSTVGTVESAHCLATGTLLDLSEQQVVSCSTNGGSMGCNGGFPPSAIDWMQQGVCKEADWPYTQQTGSCSKNCQKQTLSIGKTVKTSGESSLQTALNQQPVTVIVEAGNSVWRNYKSGVVTQCPGARSDHAVIAVGYGTSTGQYFKIKNSWGPQWGDNGYMYLQRGVGGKGMCNVAEGISYPQLNGSPGPKPSTSSPTPSISPTRKPTPTSSNPSTHKPLPTGPTRKPLPTAPSTAKPLPTAPTPTPTDDCDGWDDDDDDDNDQPTPTPTTSKPAGPTAYPTRKPLPTGPPIVSTTKPLPTAPTPSTDSPTDDPSDDDDDDGCDDADDCGDDDDDWDDDDDDDDWDDDDNYPSPSTSNPSPVPSTRKPLPTSPYTPKPTSDDGGDDDGDDCDDDDDNGGDDGDDNGDDDDCDDDDDNGGDDGDDDDDCDDDDDDDGGDKPSPSTSKPSPVPSTRKPLPTSPSTPKPTTDDDCDGWDDDDDDGGDDDDLDCDDDDDDSQTAILSPAP